MGLQKFNTVEEATDRLTSMFAESENLQKLVKMFVQELQEVEDALNTLSNSKDIDNISGIWLDYIGKIVNEPRKGREDKDYRPALKLRIAINTANGTHKDVYDIVLAYTKSSKVVLAQGILSWGHLIFDGDTSVDYTLHRLVQAIIPVTASLVVMNNTDGKCFLPAWEKSPILTTNFEIVPATGNIQPFDVHLLNNITLPFFVGIHAGRQLYDQETLGNNVLVWEGAITLTLHTGTDFLVKVTRDTQPEPLLLGGVNQKVDGTLLPWEIDDTSIPQTT